jgi:transposase
MGGMATQQELGLPEPAAPSGSVIINARCRLQVEGEHRVVVVAGVPTHHYQTSDMVAEAYAMVCVVDAGHATQQEVARAFGCSDRTIRRHQQRYRDGGMTALTRRSGWRLGRRRIAVKRIRVIERLKVDGISNREIARRLGVTEKAIRKQVGRSQAQPEQLSLRDPDERVGVPSTS